MEELNEMMETTATTETTDFGANDFDVANVEGAHPNYALIAGGVAAGAAAIGGAVALAKRVKAKRAEKKGESGNVKTKKKFCFRKPWEIREIAEVDITNVQEAPAPEPTPDSTQQ